MPNHPKPSASSPTQYNTKKSSPIRVLETQQNHKTEATKSKTHSTEEGILRSSVEAVEANKGQPVTSGGVAKITGTKRGPVRAATKKLIADGKVIGIPCESGKAKLLYKPA